MFLYIQKWVNKEENLKLSTVVKVLARDLSTSLYDRQSTPWTSKIDKFNRCDILQIVIGITLE